MSAVLPAGEAPDCVIIGGGGHAIVLIDALREGGISYSLGLTDPDVRLKGSRVLGVPVLGNDDLLPALAASGTRFFAVGVGGVRDNGPRRRLFDRARELGLIPLTIVHPRAIVSKAAILGPGCQVLAGAIVSATARLGANVVVNSGSIVEHECTVGDHANISIGACVAGGVMIGEAAHIGAGSVVRQFLRIGEEAVVGAGAVVVKNVLPRSIVVGVPAGALLRAAAAS